VDIELTHMRSLVAVAEERHFGRAAKRLQVTQPALSRRIRKLEAELGTDLVERHRRPIRLTAAGETFLEEAQVALYHAQRSVERVRSAARGELGQLSVGATVWGDTAIVPSVLRAFRARAAKVRVDPVTLTPSEQVDALRKERLDVGFTAFTPWLTEGRALNAEPLLEEPMVAIVADDHAFAEKPAVSLDELAREPFVALPQMTVPGLAYRQSAIFHERGLAPLSVQEVPDALAFFSLIAAGAGVGLHMASFSNLHRRGVAFVPLEGDPPTATLLMLHRADDQRELVQSFLDCAREVARSLDPPPVISNAGQSLNSSRLDARQRPRNPGRGREA
jgi:DNA-binding transcriptional LysR family regulator